MKRDLELSESLSYAPGTKQVNFADSDNVSQSSDDGSLGAHEDNTSDNIAERETKAIYWSRIVVAILLVCTATVAGVTTFIVTSREQENDFLSQFHNLAEQVLITSDELAKDVAGLLTTMSSTMTTFAISQGTEWPFYTHPDYEVLGSRFRHDSGAQFVSWTPIVDGEDTRQAWNQYASNNSAWLQDARRWNTQVEGAKDASATIDVVEGIFYRSEDGQQPIPEDGDGPFTPEWQMSGVPIDVRSVNYNLLRNEAYATAAKQAVEAEHPVISQILDEDTQLRTVTNDDQVMPRSMFVAPIFNNYPNNGREVVGLVLAELSWDTFFKDILHEKYSGVIVVVSDGDDYGHEFTFKIEGQEALYLGEGDLHDTTYDEYAIEERGFASFASVENKDYVYDIKVYPTEQLYNDFMSRRPIYWTIVVVFIFFLTSLLFLIYDCAVQRRQKKVITSAAKSNAIVSSLFPAEIRDRLFSNEKEKETKGNLFPHLPESSKFRLKNYLAEEDVKTSTPPGLPAVEEAAEEDEDADNEKETSKPPPPPPNVDIYETKPIADLFPNTTVMFADIAGFTAWSSVREPSQVFTLLETVYRAFDSIAKRRRVFKVETVGDCYVAVTGLPEARKDHAIVMARFSRECLDKFNELAKQLEIKLGPDTGDLAIRVGLHSGPVTAGVLRGDKSRFQLFGDTVNTAARVESTGQRGRIHLSHETAELLSDAGKSHWVKKRPETVVAKGKGEMQTYWLQKSEEVDPNGMQEEEKVKEPVLHSAPKLSDATAEQLEESLPPKVKRLVSWNVEILKKLLKQIVAKRNANAKRKNYDDQLTKMEKDIGRSIGVLDEVVEIIALPKFDHKAHKNQENPNKIAIDDEIVNQLRLYVSTVAAIHRDNPFHNFEHASHVTMSVSKLLSRIVAPDEIINQEENAGKGEKLASDLHDHTYGITSDPLTQFSVVLAALIHDVDHAGVSNFQLIKENHKLAHIFKNKSVAEQNSIVLAWEKLMSSRFTELRRCIYSEPSELERFRQLVTNSVLATDIFDKELQSLRKIRWEKAFQNKYNVSAGHDDVNRKATIVIEHLIQASDVSHTMQHWHIYQKWNERLFHEMTFAYQNGRMEKNPADGWYKGELGFLDNYIIPLAKKLKECGVFGVSSDEYLNYALENRREWATKGEEVVARMIAKYHDEETEKKAPSTIASTPVPAKKDVSTIEQSTTSDAKPNETKNENGGKMKRRSSQSGNTLPLSDQSSSDSSS